MRFMPKSMARLRRWVRATRRWEKCFFDAARKKNGQTSVSPISSYVRIPQSGGGEEKNGAPSLIIHIAMALANASCCSASPGLPGRRKTTVTPDVAERVVRAAAGTAASPATAARLRRSPRGDLARVNLRHFFRI